MWEVLQPYDPNHREAHDDRPDSAIKVGGPDTLTRLDHGQLAVDRHNRYAIGINATE